MNERLRAKITRKYEARGAGGGEFCDLNQSQKI